ncbi:MAG: bifunctional nuclease family protein [Deltaproteobacteria bacterium]|nr:bifunctional nuclease family protein [Deltaproteobacteria bacterium]
MRAMLAAVVLVSGLGVGVVAAPLARKVTAAPAAPAPAPAAKMTELRVRDVVPLASVHQAAVILTPVEGDMIVPVLISEDEGEQLSKLLRGKASEGGLLRQALSKIGGKLVRVELMALQGDSVTAQAIVDTGGHSVTLQGSAADTIGLAVEKHVPVMASKAVMDGLGLTREQIRALVRGQPDGDDDSPSQPGQGKSGGEKEISPGDTNSISL